MVAYSRPPGTRTSSNLGFGGHGLLRIPFSHCAKFPNDPSRPPVSSSSGISAGLKGPVRCGFGEGGDAVCGAGVGFVDEDGFGTGLLVGDGGFGTGLLIGDG